MYRFIFLFAAFLGACTAPNRILTYKTSTRPLYPIEPAPSKIIVVNMYDVSAKKFRDNKEEVVTGLINNLLDWMAGSIRVEQHIPATALVGYNSPGTNKDSTLRQILARENASHALVIDFFDVYFEQTRVEVTKETNGSKNREAFYDILADIGYSLYTPGGGTRQLPVQNRRHHSSRSVISGLLAAGPSIVSKREDAREMALDNGQLLLYNFFPGVAQRSFPVFSTKGFETVNACLSRMDYECALTESLRLAEDRDTEKAAKANYNCAVLFDRKNQPEEVLKYLRKSLSLFPLAETKRMLALFERE